MNDIDAIIAAIRAVTSEDLVRVLGELMRPGQVCLVGLGPVGLEAVSDLELVC